LQKVKYYDIVKEKILPDTDLKGGVCLKQVTYSEVETADFYYGHTVGEDFFTNIPAHTHNRCELLFVTKGNITYVVEGKNYQITKNSLIISRALEAHAIIPNEPTEYDRYDIVFDETKCGAEVYQKIPKGVDVIKLHGNDLVCGLFKKMEYYCGNAEGEILENLLKNLTEEILFNVALIAQDQTVSSTSTANPVILDAIAYINENITDSLSIEEICEALYITKSYLHRLFVTQLNTTPKKYIMIKKLRMAQADLLAGGHPTEVAAHYGFANYATFYRNYKQYFGVVPSEWTAITNERNYF